MGPVFQHPLFSYLFFLSLGERGYATGERLGGGGSDRREMGEGGEAASEPGREGEVASSVSPTILVPCARPSARCL